ncbi:MAG: bifunctional phosphopantothenoylcysteine decarboxylase/phosphopantothenate--cysteine ligase CoaBC [Candidatus Cloacimonetes bacterium]|nr:bifunctional phosphopantothenoylcysteine decarboxylase/phosphopantothenate--cysteine ligase CoaBC [Candidatus Cloacimonadota bacterium]
MSDPNPKVLLCVTGGIAAYKAIDLLSMLKKQHFDVKVILTKAACEFVTPLCFRALSGNEVYTDLFTAGDPIPHINLAGWADIVVLAPATANIIAKAVHGLADDLVSSTLLAARCPLLFVPAMNVHMYENPATQANLLVLKQRGMFVLEPDSGMLACGYEGRGKYPPNEEVLYSIKTYLSHPRDLEGKKILITAGATTEAIDPMRHISNRSSGKMGFALARAAALRGAEVHLIHANSSQVLPFYLSSACHTPEADSMYEEVLNLSPGMDWIIKCAAVADYKPLQASPHKIRKGEELLIRTTPTRDILLELGRIKPANQKLIGFAAETQDLELSARLKLKQKNLDLIIANNLEVSGKDETSIKLISPDSMAEYQGDKFSAAHIILDRIKNL